MPLNAFDSMLGAPGSLGGSSGRPFLTGDALMRALQQPSGTAMYSPTGGMVWAGGPDHRQFQFGGTPFGSQNIMDHQGQAGVPLVSNYTGQMRPGIDVG